MPFLTLGWSKLSPLGNRTPKENQRHLLRSRPPPTHSIIKSTSHLCDSRILEGSPLGPSRGFSGTVWARTKSTRGKSHSKGASFVGALLRASTAASCTAAFQTKRLSLPKASTGHPPSQHYLKPCGTSLSLLVALPPPSSCDCCALVRSSRHTVGAPSLSHALTSRLGLFACADNSRREKTSSLVRAP